MAKSNFEVVFSPLGEVDASAGIIRNVSIATIGEAKGHDQFVDKKTLNQFLECANGYRSGVKVLMNHEGDVKDIVGNLRSFKIKGDKLVADLHLLKTSSHRGYVLELAEEMPDTFGLSTTFENTPEEIDGVLFARCAALYSVDLVTEPAANASGLFQKVDNSNKEKETHKMTPEEFSTAFKAMFAECMAPVEEKLSAFSKFQADCVEKLSKFEAPVPKEEEKPETVEMDAKIKRAIDDATEAALTKFTAALGTRAPAATVPKEESVKTFSMHVAEATQNFKGNRKEAIRFCVAKFPKEHREAIEKNEQY